MRALGQVESIGTKIDEFFSFNRNEQCFILMGKYIPRLKLWYGYFDKYSLGLPTEVKFDWEHFWKNRKKIVGSIHTHPEGLASPSSTDYGTFHAWVTACDKPIVCCILGRDGLRAHWFFDDEGEHVEGKVWRVSRGLIMGTIPGRR